jgi:hypothetical protein
MDENQNYVQYTVERKAEGVNLVKKIFAMTVYILFIPVFIGVFIVWLKLWPVGAISPIFLWMTVYFTWPYIAVENEYTLKTGLFTFYEVYGKAGKDGRRKDKKICEAYVRDMTRIAPLSTLPSDAPKPKRVYNALSASNSPDAYYADFKNAAGEDCRVLFDATVKTIKIMKFYNKDALVEPSTPLRH